MARLAGFQLVVWVIITLLITFTIITAHSLVDKPSGWILYTVNQANGRDQIYRLQLDSKEKQLLSDQFLTVLTPTWSPDGTQIAFLASGDVVTPGVTNNFKLSLYVMRANGTGLRRLAQAGDPYLYSGYVEWSQDAKRVLFSIRDGMQPPVYYRVSSHGGHLQQWIGANNGQWEAGYWVGVDHPTEVTPATLDRGDFRRITHPASLLISPDGRWSLMPPLEHEPDVLYCQALGVSGAEPKALVHAPGAILSRLWSPDGNTIWFTVLREYGGPVIRYEDGTDLYRLHLESGGVELVLSNDVGDIRPLQWLDGGERLLIQASQIFRSGAWETDLYTLPKDGESLSSLASIQRVTQHGNLSGYMDWTASQPRSSWWTGLIVIEVVGLGVGLHLWGHRPRRDQSLKGEVLHRRKGYPCLRRVYGGSPYRLQCKM